MKSCHLCERILKGGQIIECSSCSKVICHPCIYKYFSKRTDVLEIIANKKSNRLKMNQCLICTKDCPCMKCKTVESVIYTHPNAQVINGINNLSLVSQQEPIPESGLFKGKKISEMPLFMQRIYLKKKALYSNHQISKHNSGISLQPQNEQAEEKDKEQEKKEAEESVLRNIEEVQQENVVMRDQQHLQQGKYDNVEDDDQVQDYQSQFASRRAQHVHRHDQQSDNQPGAQSQLPDEVASSQNNEQQVKPERMQSEEKEDQNKRRKMIRQRLQNMKDESSPAEIVSE